MLKTGFSSCGRSTTWPPSSRRHVQTHLKVVLFLLIATILGRQMPGHARELNPDEQYLAAELASQVPWAADQHHKVTSHPLATQTLFIERQEDKKVVHERIARVYQYDYTRQSARLLIIDLDSQALIGAWPVHSHHLPLNQTEIDFARELLAADESLISQLRAEQSRRAIEPFASLSELDVKASIFEPQDAAHPCAASRCALLSLFDDSLTVFTTEPIVFLNLLRTGLLHQP